MRTHTWNITLFFSLHSEIQNRCSNSSHKINLTKHESKIRKNDARYKNINIHHLSDNKLQSYTSYDST